MNSPYPDYPRSLGELEDWARTRRMPRTEARLRFVQYQALLRIAGHGLGRRIALKGGIALRLLRDAPRATLDIDFSALADFPESEEEIQALFSSAFAPAAGRQEIKFDVRSVAKSPARLDASHPTYIIKIAYCLLGDKHYEDFPAVLQRRNLPEVLPIEVSIKEVVCEHEAVRLGAATDVRIVCCSAADTLAEKLRALLQQVTRNRNRRQDLYDLAWVWDRCRGELDLVKIRNFLVRKASARGIEVTEGSYNDEVRDRAQVDYASLFDREDPDHVPFETAWQRLQEFVRALDLPRSQPAAR